jgi:hypothetical protein
MRPAVRSLFSFQVEAFEDQLDGASDLGGIALAAELLDSG